VHVGLVADVENKAVRRRIEDGVERDRKFNHAEVWPEMAAGLGQNGNQFVADFLRQLGQLLHRDFFDVGGGINGVEKACHK